MSNTNTPRMIDQVKMRCFGVIILLSLIGCNNENTQPMGSIATTTSPERSADSEQTGGSKLAVEKLYNVVKTKQQWREQLSEEQYRITREKGTEGAFTGVYWNSKDKGVYQCVCCGQPLYESDTKFDSGTGWPSFYKAVNNEAVATEEDSSFGMTRIEVMCSNCGAHLGHIFNDGPAPTGLRHCINSASLDLKAEDE